MPGTQIRTSQLKKEIDAFNSAFLGLENLDKSVSGISLFHTLFRDLHDFTCREGKRIRPLLFLKSVEIFSSVEVDREALVKVAGSLEMLHAFILIHDDLVDRSETRRNLPSLHKLIESRLATLHNRQQTAQNLALVLGDLLFTRAQQAVLSSGLANRADLLQTLLGYISDTGCGELADILYGVRDVSKVEKHEIEEMYWLKTSRYTIECPLVLGAVLAGADESILEAITALSRPAGLAFQIQNDLRDFSRFEISDVDIPDDLLEGKKTLLVRTAYERLDDMERTLLQLCLGSPIPTEATVGKAKELILKSGAESVLRERMENLFEEACSVTKNGPFSPAQSEALLEVLTTVRQMIG